MQRLLFAVVLLAAVISLAGCSADSRLLGKWVFDRAKTEANKPKPVESSKSADSKDFLGEMKRGLAEQLVPTLIAQLDGASLTITKREMTITLKNGTGEVETYEILERPDANTWRVKTSKNKVETYKREGEWLCSPASGDVNLVVYFREAK